MKLLFLSLSLLFIACASTPRDLASVDEKDDKKDNKRTPTSDRMYSPMIDR